MKKQSDKHRKNTLWDIITAAIVLYLLIKLGIADHFYEYGGIIIFIMAVIYVSLYEIFKKNKTK